jgi:hypothetical protein
MSTSTTPATLALSLAALAMAGALTGCGSDDPKPTATRTTDVAAPSASSATTDVAEPVDAGPTLTPVTRTPELDAVGVIGHSGAMGYNSDGQDHDVPENSWVTGTNPKVDSIYRRLLADHPAIKGHNWNEAVSGSSVTSLMHQAQLLLTHDPVPDIVFIVSIDNDVRCDGTDDDNYDTYEAAVADVVDYLQGSAPGLKVFFNDTPFSVHEYDAALMTLEHGPAHLDFPGPCDPISDDGQIDPAGEAYQQQVYDEYLARLEHVCAERSDCATDEGALQAEDFTATAKDFTEDMNHLTVSGLAREAAVVWELLPPAWTK